MNRITTIIILLLFWISCSGSDEYSLPPVTAGSQYPNIVSSNDGSLFMIWTVENDNKASIVFSEFGGNGWSNPSSVFSSDSLFVNWADFPSIFHVGGDSLIVHWLQKSAGGTFDYNVKISFSSNRGQSWSKPIIPHRDQLKGEHGFLTFYKGKDQQIGFAWLDGRHMGEYDIKTHTMGDMALYQSSLLNGKLAPERILDNRVCECCPTDAVAIPGGTLIAYRDRSEKEIRNINVVRIMDGIAQKPVTVHDDHWFIPGCPVNGPASGVNGNNVAVAWFTSPEKTPQVNVIFSSDGGQTFGEPIRIDDGNPIGRVDVEWINENQIIISWIEETDKGANLYTRNVKLDSSFGEMNLVSEMDAGRGSGYPIMSQFEDALFFTWTNPKKPVKIESCWIKINDLLF